jgi:cytochrome c oxidase subunit IV
MADAAHAHKGPSYMAIWGWLAILTVLEVGAYFLPPPSKWVLLVAFAVAKAALVGLYFMHLRFETRTLSYIALTPLVIAVLLLLVLIPDHTFTPHKTDDAKKVVAPAKH